MRKYLRFVWMTKVYHFVSLPFGLSPAPYIFTMVAKQLALLTREQGIRLKMYLDDWLNLNQSRERCAETTEKIILLSQELGFNIKAEKSDFVPSNKFKYLGMTFDTVKFTVCSNPDRIENLLSVSSNLPFRFARFPSLFTCSRTHSDRDAGGVT